MVEQIGIGNKVGKKSPLFRVALLSLSVSLAQGDDMKK